MTARIVNPVWDEESRPSYYMTRDYATRRRLGPSDLCASSERTHDLRPSMPTGWAPSESMFAGHGRVSFLVPSTRAGTMLAIDSGVNSGPRVQRAKSGMGMANGAWWLLGGPVSWPYWGRQRGGRGSESGESGDSWRLTSRRSGRKGR